jgi:autotransporter passenger strand-loop-strand repeat protein
VSSGGLAVVSSGGAANGVTLSSGSELDVLSGGSLGGTTLSGGFVELKSGGTTGASQINFATSAGGTLQLDDSVHFGGKISGFGVPGAIDLRDIAFGSGTTLGFTEALDNTSGTLTVNDGTHMANITLLGQYVAGNFTKQSDGNGGTLITDPPVPDSFMLTGSPWTG